MMPIKLMLANAALLFSLAALASIAAAAAPTVNVVLEDSSNDPAIASMRLSLDRAAVAAGRVIFHATNRSKEMVHEVVVIRVDPKRPALPYDEKKGEVIGKQVHRAGEIPELKPGPPVRSRSALSPVRTCSYVTSPGTISREWSPILR
jgi:uncharacterized cupredoxin-like copper-binding protein